MTAQGQHRKQKNKAKMEDIKMFFKCQYVSEACVAMKLNEHFDFFLLKQQTNDCHHQISSVVSNCDFHMTFPKRRESWDCKCSSFNKVKTNLFLW